MIDYITNLDLKFLTGPKDFNSLRVYGFCTLKSLYNKYLDF